MMITFFNHSVVNNYRLFYLLDNITDTNLEIHRRTPAGDEEFEHADVFIMNNGKLLVAFKHPFSYAPNICLIAKTETQEEIINLTPWERLIDVYDPGIDNTDYGYFAFTDSRPIFEEGSEWRCDNTMYGPRPFFVGQVAPTIQKVKGYETILSVHGVGYLVYIHLEDDAIEREKFKNDSEVPCAGLTLSEAFKVMLEWSETTQEPFNSTENIAVKAQQFLNQIGFTADLVDNQVDMQVANYLKGSTSARLRPEGVQPNKPELIGFIQKKMASSSLALIHHLYPELTELENVLSAEQDQLEAGIQRFRDFYQIPNDWPLSDTQRIIEHCTLYFNPTIGPYVHNQLRLFANKQQVLDKVATGTI